MTLRERIEQLQRSGIYPDLVDVLSEVAYRLEGLEDLVARQAELLGELRGEGEASGRSGTMAGAKSTSSKEKKR